MKETYKALIQRQKTLTNRRNKLQSQLKQTTTQLIGLPAKITAAKIVYDAAEAKKKLNAAERAKREKIRNAVVDKFLDKYKNAYRAPAGKHAMPNKGKAFIAYKSVWIHKDGNYIGSAVLALLVPANAQRYQANSSSYDPKIRVSEVKVLGVVKTKRIKYNPKEHKLVSTHDASYEYKVGARQTPSSGYFASSYSGQCASGLHCFMQMSKAYEYL